MILLNNLYRIVSDKHENDIARFEILINPEHFIYQVHFPNEPITPGVCILQIAKELMEICINGKLSIYQVKNVKFLSVISPKDNNRVTYTIEKLTHIDKGDLIKAQIIVSNKDIIYAKISIICK